MLYRLLATLLTRSKLIGSNSSQNDCIYAVDKGQYGRNVLQSVVIDSAMHFARCTYTYYKYVRIYPTLQSFTTKKFSQIAGNGEAEIFAKENFANESPRRKGSSRIPASKQGLKPCQRFDQMLWPSSGRRWPEHLVETSAWFSTCFEAGIRELPFLMPEPAEKPSLHSYLRERYGSST